VAVSKILPAKTLLFHGTTEEIRGRLDPGGNRVLWFADDPKIAQLYIPRAGLSTIASASSLRLPTKHESLRTIQKAIGIDYDLGQVEWDRLDKPRSFASPRGWKTLPTDAEIQARIEALGYVPYRGMLGTYEFYFEDDDLLPPGGLEEGELFVVAPKRDMAIADLTDLGSDLQDPAHLWLNLFRRLEDDGFDGVVIDDYAQSEEWGNFGHRSLGIFRPATRDLKVVDRVPATYEEFRFEGVGTRAWPYPDDTNFLALPVDPRSQEALAKMT
jgi:hypothetical protein